MQTDFRSRSFASFIRAGMDHGAGEAARDLVRTVRDARKIRALRRNAPAQLRPYLDGMPIVSMRDSLKVKRHRMFRVGSDMVLHLYDPRVGPIRRGLADRLKLTPQTGLRVPHVHLHLEADANEAGDPEVTIWLLEERLHGDALSVLPEASWQASAIEGLACLGENRGPPLGECDFWTAHADPSVAAAPQALQGSVANAWHDLSRLPAAPVHGDTQPKNIVAGATIGLIDWEGFWLYGLPGIDLAFLTIMAGHEKPDPARFASLLQGQGPFAAAMRQLRTADDTYRSALLAMLAIWNHGEVRKQLRDQNAMQARPFLDLLTRFGCDLVRR